MSQTLNEADLDGIAGQGSDRDLVRLLLEKQRDASSDDVDDIRITADHLDSRTCWRSLSSTARGSRQEPCGASPAFPLGLARGAKITHGRLALSQRRRF